MTKILFVCASPHYDITNIPLILWLHFLEIFPRMNPNSENSVFGVITAGLLCVEFGKMKQPFPAVLMTKLNQRNAIRGGLEEMYRGGVWQISRKNSFAPTRII